MISKVVAVKEQKKLGPSTLTRGEELARALAVVAHALARLAAGHAAVARAHQDAHAAGRQLHELVAHVLGVVARHRLLVVAVRRRHRGRHLVQPVHVVEPLDVRLVGVVGRARVGDEGRRAGRRVEVVVDRVRQAHGVSAFRQKSRLQTLKHDESSTHCVSRLASPVPFPSLVPPLTRCTPNVAFDGMLVYCWRNDCRSAFPATSWR